MKQQADITADRIKNPEGCTRVTRFHVSILALLLSILFLSPASGFAKVFRYDLDFNDRYFGYNNQKTTTLRLKRALKRQYPWVDVQNLRLKSVILVAKSRVGRGHAQLRIGHQRGDYVRIGGHPRQFNKDHRKTFDRVRLDNPSRRSWGPWQVNLYGTFKVRRVVLFAEDPYRKGRDFYSSYF